MFEHCGQTDDEDNQEGRNPMHGYMVFFEPSAQVSYNTKISSYKCCNIQEKVIGRGKSKHYEYVSMLYPVTFYGFEKDNFQMKNCDFFGFFAQIMDCGYTLEPSH